MPLFGDDEITADEAIAKGLCPECGHDFKLENAIAHLNNHWKAPIPLDKRGDEPRRRQALLEKYIADNNIRTTNMPQPAATKVQPLP
jgi:hypothetical protein